jgi:RecA-family ATPase
MTIEWFDEAAAAALNDPENPLIEDFLDEGALSVFYGDSNAGKTFVALDAVFAVATGQAWNGRRTKQGLVIYVAAEGGKKIRRRLAALAKRYEETCGDAAPTPLFAIIRYPIDLRSSDADLDELLANIKEAERATGHLCVWVVVDTLSRAMAGGDENSSVDMGLEALLRSRGHFNRRERRPSHQIRRCRMADARSQPRENKKHMRDSSRTSDASGD